MVHSSLDFICPGDNGFITKPYLLSFKNVLFVQKLKQKPLFSILVKNSEILTDKITKSGKIFCNFIFNKGNIFSFSCFKTRIKILSEEKVKW